jgi:CBS domain containing-hemolysin-like protein
LVAVAGILFGILVGRKAKGSRKEKPVAQLLALVFEPIVYWADLRGPDGRPSHSKIAYFVGLIVALYGLVAFGLKQEGDLGFGFITYAAVVLAYALGKQVFNTVLKWIVARFPGAAQSFERLSNGSMRRPPEAEPLSNASEIESAIDSGGSGKAY